jgi:DNA-binding SARP family transcriptional activator
LGQALALSQAHGYEFLFTGRERSRALPLLLKTIEVVETSMVSEVGRLLALIGAPAVEPLIELLETADEETRARVVHVLGEIGDERAMPALSRLRRNRRLQEAVRAAMERIAAAPRPLLRVLALGRFEAWRGGEPVSPSIWQPRRKARLLLLYLLSRAPRPVACDELIEALWPDLAPDSARRALNTTFSDLRHILEPFLGQGQPSRYLTRDEETLTFSGQVWYDVAEFQQAVRTGGQAARQALELYRGDFLPEEPYPDWVLRERERLRGLYLNTLTAWLEERVQAGAWREGVELARRILEQEPWLEEVWRALMRCLARLGRRSEALHAYQECVRALRREMDVAPSAETRALFDELKSP